MARFVAAGSRTPASRYFIGDPRELTRPLAAAGAEPRAAFGMARGERR